MGVIEARMRWMDKSMHELDGQMTRLDVITAPGVNTKAYWALIVTAAVLLAVARIPVARGHKLPGIAESFL